MIKKIKRNIKANKNDIKYSSMDRKEPFDYIYTENIWAKNSGEEDTKFYSGWGLHEKVYVKPYCSLVKQFIMENIITRVCDLECGDFHVASQYIDDSILYDGIDIVQKLVDYHNKKYGTDDVHFYCRDIVEDELPDAELCLIRQVLQHLSNEEVKKVLDKVKKYKYVIITEHVVKREYAREMNVDKIHGSHIRVLRQSGLYFDEEPFNLKIETLLEIPYGKGKNSENIVSVLIKNDLEEK